MPRIRSLPFLVAPAAARVALPPKAKDPIYDAPEFKRWRAIVLARAGNRCEALDPQGFRCIKASPRWTMYADHIIEVKDGGSLLSLSNGQCLCASHHEIKTLAARKFRHMTIQNLGG